jgi:hypothetical protein
LFIYLFIGSLQPKQGGAYRDIKGRYSGIEGRDSGIEGRDSGIKGRDSGIKGRDSGLKGEIRVCKRRDSGSLKGEIRAQKTRYTALFNSLLTACAQVFISDITLLINTKDSIWWRNSGTELSMSNNVCFKQSEFRQSTIEGEIRVYLFVIIGFLPCLSTLNPLRVDF